MLRRFVRSASAFDAVRIVPALRDFHAWQRSLTRGSPLDDAQPWITFAATRFLRTILKSDMRVFEWGSGGSTLFFANRQVRTVSVEHDSEWFDRVIPRLRARLEPPDVRLVESAPAADDADLACDDPNGFGSSDSRFAGMSFEAYVRAIEPFADQTFDLILIDGRSRPACIRAAIPKVRRGGWIVLDNSDREHYARGIHLLDAGFERRDFPGPIPYVEHFICTSAWRKR